MNPAPRVQRKLRIRLVVALPAVLSFFMMATATLVTVVFPHFFIPSEMTETSFNQSISLAILFMIGTAFAGNLLAGLFISRHLNGFMSKIENSIRGEHALQREVGASDEIDALNIMLDEVSITLSNFVNDSYIIDNLPEAIIAVDADCKILRINNNATKLLKAEQERFTGSNLKEFIPDNAANQELYHKIDEALKGRFFKLSVERFSIGTEECRRYWVSVHPVRRDPSLPPAVSISIKDQASIVSVRNQIQKIERLAALGCMASTIAHEIRNPLGAISTYTELIQEDLAPDDPMAAYTKKILSQIQRINHLVEDTLAFSRDPVRTVKDVNLTSLLSMTLDLAKQNFPGKAVVVEENFKPGLPTIKGDPGKLSQAFLNLFLNSFEACGESGRITISTDMKGNSNDNSGTLCVSVADSGTGIVPDNLDKIFEPFFTTKANGTGLGLATAYNILSAHGGLVEVDSEPGKGTVFNVLLPREYAFNQLQTQDKWSCAGHE